MAETRQFVLVNSVSPSRRLVGVLLAAVALGCAETDPVAPLDGCLPQYADIRDTVVARLAAVQLADASVIVSAKGEQICRLQFGSHRENPAVRIESASKWLTAATLLAATDRDLLKLTTRTGDVWPATPAYSRGITLAQLLSHTSGLFWFNRCVGRDPFTMIECAEAVLEGDMHFDAGTGFFYSAPPFTVAGALLEQVTAMSWHDNFARFIVLPLGMQHTSYPQRANPSLADGEVMSSADDFDLFLRMILADGYGPRGRVLSHEAIEAMRQPRNRDLPVYASPRGNRLYGLGSWVDSVDANGSALVLSSPGSRGFVPLVDFGRRMTFVFSADADIAQVAPAVNAILAAVRVALAR